VQWNSLITEANGGNARNASGTPNSGDSFTSGGRFFDGVDDCIGAVDSASLRFGTDPYQIHVWAKIPTDAVDGSIIMGKGIGLNVAGEWLLAIIGAAPNGELFFYADNAAITLDSNTVITDGLLHLFSVLRNGDTAKLYIDTAEVATDTTAHDLNDAVEAVQLMAAKNLSPCKGNLYAAYLGKANISIADAIIDMKKIYGQKRIYG